MDWLDLSIRRGEREIYVFSRMEDEKMRRRRWRIAGDMYGSRLGGWEFTIIFARVRTTDCEMKFCSRNFHGELYSRSISSRDKNNREDPGAAWNLCRARGSLFFSFFPFFFFFLRDRKARESYFQRGRGGGNFCHG